MQENQKIKVLIVDDESYIFDIFRKNVPEGYIFHGFDCWDEAMHFLKHEGTSVDYCLIDRSFVADAADSVLNDVANDFRRVYKITCPIVLWSSHVRDLPANHGFDVVVEKALYNAEFLKKVEKLINERPRKKSSMPVDKIRAWL